MEARLNFDGRIVGCFFHYSHALITNLDKHGLKKLYRENRDFVFFVNCLKNLAFLPVDVVPVAYSSLKSMLNVFNFGVNQMVLDFLDYYEAT